MRNKILNLISTMTVFSISHAALADTKPIDTNTDTKKNANHYIFKLMPYKENYLLPFNYSDRPYNSFYNNNYIAPNDENVKKSEVEFQFSIMHGIVERIAGYDNELFLTYTQKSFWQLYSKSAWFRETNYEPELLFRMHTDYRLNKWFFKNTDLSINHESNGRGGDAERSWNRIILAQELERGNWSFKLSVWSRIEAGTDYNPNITDYLGHGSFEITRYFDDFKISFLSQNNVESGFSKGAETLSFSYKIGNGFAAYIKLFSGYGQSLAEYDHYTNSVGVGFTLSDW
ncbi:hypothetical protein CF386_05625 [Paraphotobacterium marinum]|uniref:Phospholipase A1 n=1 Tax=Paraphotobacterium marinum TaxID=1755811 RepID=A0A220VDZ8_9GAMM|nr:phospholipase A [Paraphotobacterium marinum]ASK78520.1 hypothetical protein CF386_05625 [Paraphotobacterium marinum]